MRLDHAIRSLMRPRRNGRPGPLGALGPIGPTVGAADWPSRTVWPPPWWEGLTATGLRIEPGLLAFGAAPTAPLTVWTTTDLRDWLSGPGVQVPGSDPPVYTHLVGRVAWSAETGLVWPDAEPISAIVDGGYPSACYASTAAVAAVLAPDPPPWRLRTPAGPYTGGARLLAEACLASGRRMSERLPTAWATSPGRVGLLWSPDLEPWAVMIGSDGALAARLGLGSVGLAMRDWIAAGTLSGIALHLAWLHVAADLAPLAEPGEGDLVWLASASEMADAYDDGGYLAMAGWVWASGPGAAQGAVVVHREGTVAGYDCWESRLLTLDIAWADGQPSGTLAAEGWSAWRVRHAYHHLWAGSGGDVSQLRHAAAYPDAITDSLSESAPVVCRYLPGGALEVERYYRSAVIALGGTSEHPGFGSEAEALNNCQGGGSVTSYTGALYRVTGGVGTAEPPAVMTGGGTWEVRSWSIAPLGWSEPGSYPTNWDNTTQWFGRVACSDDVPDASWSSGGGKWTLPSGWAAAGWGLVGENAAGTAERWDGAVTAGGGGQAWVYLADAPDMSVRVDWESGDARSMEHLTWHREVSHRRRVDAWGLAPDGTWTRLYTGLGVGYMGKGYGGAVACTGVYVICSGSTPDASESESQGAYQSGTWAVRVGGGIVASGSDLTAWADLTSPTVDPLSCGLGAWLSASGSSVWVPYPGSAPDSASGVPGTALAAPRSWAGG